MPWDAATGLPSRLAESSRCSLNFIREGLASGLPSTEGHKVLYRRLSNLFRSALLARTGPVSKVGSSRLSINLDIKPNVEPVVFTAFDQYRVSFAFDIDSFGCGLISEQCKASAPWLLYYRQHLSLHLVIKGDVLFIEGDDYVGPKFVYELFPDSLIF